MNIAMFAWEALEGLSVGGGAVYASRLASALARAGHRVRLFTRQGPGQAMDEVVGGVKIRRCPWDRKRTFYEEIQGLAASFAHYFEDARKADGEYDVVHCHEWFTIDAGLKAVDINPARLAVSFHSTEWGRTGKWPDQGDSARIAMLEREGVERADVVVAASQWARRTIHEQFHPPDWKCEVVRHGADLRIPPDIDAAAERFRRENGLAAERPMALFAGRFSRQGGGDAAALAARLAAERFPEARFVFVGSGPLEAEMREIVGGNAVFLPPRGRIISPACYWGADLVLAPFRRDYTGRAVLPAWAAAKPAATLAGTVPSEFVVHETNGWVTADDPAELAGAVMAAFADPAHTAWMGRNGRVAAETAFSWDESAKRLLAAYTRRETL